MQARKLYIKIDEHYIYLHNLNPVNIISQQKYSGSYLHEWAWACLILFVWETFFIVAADFIISGISCNMENATNHKTIYNGTTTKIYNLAWAIYIYI